jgi:3-hydroxyacyl-CoA dehydrogenase/enoyl-CoA hydratase/3-hydroxybutyryl-CoA epimerase
MPREILILEQFRIEEAREGLIHLVFDMPDRSMNVFSNAAIQELGRFSAWLKQTDVRGVVVRSGKASAFCAGADLGELGAAYDMIVAAPEAERFQLAFDHFFPLSQAIRGLETSGKPIAAAIGGLALGGGCELALGTHHRVLVDTPKAALGLPESLVGLLPGGGGTQRLPRLIEIDRALPILLAGARLSGRGALEAGLVDQLVPDGEEVAAAERWLLSTTEAIQPWDRPEWTSAAPAAASTRVAKARRQVLSETLGHQPAPLAILDCIEQGLPLPFDDAIRTEMSLFSKLIQRREPRNMIRTLFIGKLDYERDVRAGSLAAAVEHAIAALSQASREAVVRGGPSLAAAGFVAAGDERPGPVQEVVGQGYWIDGGDDDPRRAVARAALMPLVGLAKQLAAELTDAEKRRVDFAMVSQAGFPAYLGGPIAFAETR